MTPDQRARLEACAREKLAESRSFIHGTGQQRERAFLDAIYDGYGKGWLEGLNEGARIATAAALDAIGRAPVPEAAYPVHSVEQLAHE